MSSGSQPNTRDADELEAAVDQAIATCGGDMRFTIRALIVANEYLESDVWRRHAVHDPRVDCSERIFGV
jgi:hypothetical protein